MLVTESDGIRVYAEPGFDSGKAVEPDVGLPNAQLRVVSADEMWAHFAPHMGPLGQPGLEWTTYEEIFADESGDWTPSPEVWAELVESPTVNIRPSAFAGMQEAA